MRKLGFYLLRWQLSSPILALCIYFIPVEGWLQVVIANLIGGLIFYHIDKRIFQASVKRTDKFPISAAN